MKILMVAIFDKGSTNIAQATGFKLAGAKVIEYNYRQRALEIGDYNRDSEIIEICKKEKPSFIFFSKANKVNIRVIDACNNYSTTLLWYMDPMENYDSELQQKFMQCNIVCCALYTPFITAIKYNNNSYLVPEGFDSTIDKPIKGLKKCYDVSFIGYLKHERSIYYNKLHFNIINNAFGIKHAEAVSRSKINLNFVVNREGISDRVYKILAAKGFLLTNEWPNIEEYFTPGKDFILFKNISDLERKIKYYLKNKKERRKIAKNGYKTVQKYNRNNFAERIIDIYEKCI